MKASISDDYANLRTVTESLHNRDRITSCESNVYESPVVSVSKSPFPGVPLTTKTKPATVSAVCLGLLCVLLLAGIIGLWFYHTEEENKWEKRLFDLQTSYNNLTQESRQLQTSYNDLTKERDQLQTRYNNLTKERDQLQTRYNNLTKAFYARPCPSGWVKFGCSFYLISYGSKTWLESSNDCVAKGAHLVIINSSEEQAFVSARTNNQRAWIGLYDPYGNRNFRWVDGSSLTTGYWASGEPNNYGGPPENCVEIKVFVASLNGWNDESCGYRSNWVCEL